MEFVVGSEESSPTGSKLTGEVLRAVLTLRLAITINSYTRGSTFTRQYVH